MPRKLLVEDWYEEVEAQVERSLKGEKKLIVEVVGEPQSEHARVAARLWRKYPADAGVRLHWQITPASNARRLSEDVGFALLEALEPGMLRTTAGSWPQRWKAWRVGRRLRRAASGLTRRLEAGRPEREWRGILRGLVHKAVRELGVVAHVELAIEEDNRRLISAVRGRVMNFLVQQGASVIASGDRAWLDPGSATGHELFRLPEPSPADFTEWIGDRWQKLKTDSKDAVSAKGKAAQAKDATQTADDESWAEIVAAATFPSAPLADQILHNLAMRGLMHEPDDDLRLQALFLFILNWQFPAVAQQVRHRPQELVNMAEVLTSGEPAEDALTPQPALFEGLESPERLQRFTRFVATAFSGENPLVKPFEPTEDLKIRIASPSQDSDQLDSGQTGSEEKRLRWWDKVFVLPKERHRLNKLKGELTIPGYETFRSNPEIKRLAAGDGVFAEEVGELCLLAIKHMQPDRKLAEVREIEKVLDDAYTIPTRLEVFCEVLFEPELAITADFKKILKEFLSVVYQAKSKPPASMSEYRYLEAIGDYVVRSGNHVAIRQVAKLWENFLNRRESEIGQKTCRRFVEDARRKLAEQHDVVVFLSWRHGDKGASLTVEREELADWRKDRVDLRLDRHAAEQREARTGEWPERLYGSLKDAAVVVIPNLSRDYRKGQGVTEELEFVELLYGLRWTRLLFRTDEPDAVPSWMRNAEIFSKASRGVDDWGQKRDFQKALVAECDDVRKRAEAALDTLDGVLKTKGMSKHESRESADSVVETHQDESQSPEETKPEDIAAPAPPPSAMKLPGQVVDYRPTPSAAGDNGNGNGHRHEYPSVEGEAEPRSPLAGLVADRVSAAGYEVSQDLLIASGNGSESHAAATTTEVRVRRTGRDPSAEPAHREGLCFLVGHTGNGLKARAQERVEEVRRVFTVAGDEDGVYEWTRAGNSRLRSAHGEITDRALRAPVAIREILDAVRAQPSVTPPESSNGALAGMTGDPDAQNGTQMAVEPVEAADPEPVEREATNT